MVRFTGGLLLFSAFVAAAPTERHAQLILQSDQKAQPRSPRKLQGRFLHITDVHPDPFYRVHSSTGELDVCHRGSGTAGHYGAEKSECDTPFSLVNATFKWIEENIKDKVDFVVWTGDSARHDNDDDYPRTDEQVISQNNYLVSKMGEVFGKDDNKDDPDPTNDYVIPIVPTYGNNDFLPHNIFTPGPNRWTREFLSIWNTFVPQEQRHSFARGGWFFTEVIPNRLAVFSLNTMYFFDSNSAVDGCDDKSEPGYEHMEWLRIQLQFLRDRKMKAILIGHVPPARTASKQNWDETCYQKYTLWMRQYRDVVITSIWGHMNIDHFMFQDVKDLNYKFKIPGVDKSLRQILPEREREDLFKTSAKAAYLNELRAGWSNLPKPPKGSSYFSISDEAEMLKGGKKSKKGDQEKFLKDIGGQWGERFSLSLVSPSVVPNYLPTLRIVEYNITGMEDDHPAASPVGLPAPIEYELQLAQDSSLSTELEMEDFEDEWVMVSLEDGEETDTMYDDDSSAPVHELKKKKKKKGRKGKKKKKVRAPFTIPRPPSLTSAPGPAYSPQPLTLISYTQLYSNLTKINEDYHSDLVGMMNIMSREEAENILNEKHKHFKYQLEYTSSNDSVYQMKDLTIRSWLDLAEHVGRSPHALSLSAVEGDTEFELDSFIRDCDKIDGEGKNEDESDCVETSKKSKKGKHKKEKENSKLKNRFWKTFIKRAFVLTKTEEDLDEDFGLSH